MIHIENDIYEEKPMKILKILPTDPIQPIAPIPPIKRRKQKAIRGKKNDIVSDENLGKNVDITLKGPLKVPDCFTCVSYFVTWDPNFPHGCKKFKFKKREGLPSLSVYEANRSHCPFFEENKKIKK